MNRVPVVLIAICLLLCFAAPAHAQQSDQSASAQQGPTSHHEKDTPAVRDRQEEMSSSKDTRIDLSPPPDDAKKHPNSGTAMMDAEDDSNSDITELHPWDPHKAAKDVEVGDFYFKRKNYKAAIDRYKEALIYKPNDAEATFRLAESEDKTGDSPEAITHYEAYLKILPEGSFANDAHKALERLHGPAEQGGSADK